MIIPDLRGPDASESTWLRVVYQNGQKCIVAPTSVIVNEYLQAKKTNSFGRALSAGWTISRKPVRQCMATSMRS